MAAKHPPPPDRHCVTLGDAAPWLRRTVGPVAWSVLETLAEHARNDHGNTVSCRSVRDLAGELRLANDTVARALRRLADAGLAVHEADRESSGRFGAGRYVLTVPPNVFVEPAVSGPTAVLAASSRRRVPRPADEQLALLPEV
jgi:DNA-binding transcriptional MocR family regulator